MLYVMQNLIFYSFYMIRVYDPLYSSIHPMNCLQSENFKTLIRFPFVSTVTSFPDGHFDMSALDRLEVAGISIFNTLAPKFLSMALGLHFPVSIFDNLRKENNPVEGSRAMMKAWLFGKSPLPPTWQVLLEKLQLIDMGELVQEMEHFFNRKPAASLVIL